MALTKISTAMWNSVPHHDTHDFNVDDVLYVDVSANNVGIGTTSPDIYGFGGKLLTISGAGTYTNLIIAGDTNSGISFGTTSGRLGQITMDSSAGLSIATQGTGAGTSMVIDRSGNVGIGTTNPSAKIDIRTTSDQAIYAYTDGGYNAIEFTCDSGTTTGSLLAYSGTIRLGNASGVGGWSNGLVIDSSGNVGIGTVSPSQKLTVEGDIELGTGGYIYGDTTNPRVYLNNANGAFLMYGGSSYIGVGSSNVSASVNIHAPAFYDSDNTGYYVDPASRSNLGTLVVNSAAANSSGYGADFYGHLHMHNYEINYVSQLHFNDNVRFYDEGNDSYLNFKWGDTGAGGIKFVDGDGLTHGWVFGDGAGGFGLLDKDGQWALYTNGASELQLRSNDNIEFIVYNSYTYSPGSSRAPIFYDSDDTNYYVDPTGNSKLKYIASGDAGVLASGYGITSYDSKRYLIGFKNSSATGTNYPWLVHDDISGGSGFIVHFNGVGDKMTLNELGSLTATGDMRAPIFYDSDNTGYYVNPAGRSQLGFATFDGYDGLTGDNTRSTVGVSIGRYNSEYSYIELASSNASNLSWIDFSKADGNDYWHRIRGYHGYLAFWGAQNEEFRIYSTYTLALGSSRAPIFYDSDNTNWYVNPASTSTTDPSGKFAQYVQIGDSATYNSNDGTWGARLNVTDNVHARIDVAQDANSMRSTWYAHTGNTGPIFGSLTAHPMRMMYNGSEVGFWNSTELQHSSSVRAPIFYDSDNTGYYLNPQSFSNLGSIKLNEVISSSDVGDARIGRNYAYNTLELKGYGAEMMIGAGNTALHINYRYCNNTANTSQTPQDWYWKAGTSTTYSNHYWGNGYGLSSLRAPIFYDHDNTSYYVDPHSSGTSISVRGVIQNPSIWINDGDNYNGYDENIRLFNPPNGVSTIAFSASGTSGTPTTSILGFSDRFETRIGSTWRTRLYGGYLEVNGHANATLFYDSNNTAYYGNFADTNNSIVLSGGIKFGSTNAESQGGFIGRHEVLATDLYPSPIYSIGSNYRPSGTGLSNHYGVGYGHTNASFYGLTGQNGWGFYVSDAGVARVQLGASNGTISCTGDVVAYASDGRLKENIKPIENALDKINKINGVYYDWVENITEEYDFHPSKMHEVGVIAQEVQKVLPEVVDIAPFDMLYSQKTGRRKLQEKMETEQNRAVSKEEAKKEYEKLTIEEQKALQDKNDFLTVKYERLVPLLIEAIKELSEKVKILENK